MRATYICDRRLATSHENRVSRWNPGCCRRLRHECLALRLTQTAARGARFLCFRAPRYYLIEFIDVLYLGLNPWSAVFPYLSGNSGGGGSCQTLLPWRSPII